MNYDEMKKMFERNCGLHQDDIAYYDAKYLCAGCRYSSDQALGECMAHWMHDVLTGKFYADDRLRENLTLTERKNATLDGDLRQNCEKITIACKKTAQIGNDINALTISEDKGGEE